jgi:hypothetical protein
MAQTAAHSEEKITTPPDVVLVSLLLLIYGIVGLAGCFFLPRDATLPYYVVRSIAFIIAAVLMLLNHGWTLSFAFLSAVFLTIDAALQYSLLHDLRLSILPMTQAIRFLVNTALNWTAYLWYRKWKVTSGGCA